MVSRHAAASSFELAETEIQIVRGNVTHAHKIAALGELATGISHDFRNILQTVLSLLDMIDVRSNDPAEVRRLTNAALGASERGIAVINRILKFSHRTTSEAKPACLLSSLESATAMLVGTVGARMNVRIEPPSPDLWWSVIDPAEFELALINLGINARDAMPEGGQIRLSARNVTIPSAERRAPRTPVPNDAADRRGSRLPLPGGDYVAVTVGDTGTGMDDATLGRAVEPFFTTKPIGKGTGLGLSIVHTLTTEAGGALRLMSKPGRGTIVEMWLPRAQEPLLPPPASHFST